MLQLLREMGSTARTEASSIDDATVAKQLLSDGERRYPLASLAFMDRPYPALVTAHAYTGNDQRARALRGIRRMLSMLREECDIALALCGAASPAALERSLVV